MTKNKQLLIEQHILGREEFEDILSTLEIPKREAESKAKRRKMDEDIIRQSCIAIMRQAKSEQEAVANGLAILYTSLVGEDETLDAIKKLADIRNLDQFYAQLNEIAENPKIKTTIGNELAQLRGHMLYRVWENPELLAANPDQALRTFEQAAGSRDINAMINLYRDFLKREDPLRKKALSIVFDLLTRAMDRDDIQALIDSYLYFFKASEQQETALLFLEEYAQKLIEHRDLENLKKLLVCFENTRYEREIKDRISALELEMGHQISMTPSATGQLPRQVLYDEWQAACTNQDLARLLELQEQVIQQGIVAQDVAEAIIQSIVQ